MSLDIRIKTISQEKQRYETAGDYWTDKKGIEQIRVTDLGNRKHELLVAVHELVEDFICQDRNIAEPDVMKFDIMFEEERSRGLHSKEAEPGNDKRAPYRKEHRFATKIEKLVAKELGCDWLEYLRSFI